MPGGRAGAAGTLEGRVSPVATHSDTKAGLLLNLDWQFNGMPLHVLFIHFVVIVVPLAALLTVLAAAWPAARRRIGVLAPVVALAALVSVPITVEAGEWLAGRVAQTPLLAEHVAIGEQLLPWTAGLFVIALVQWAWFRFDATASAAEAAGASRVDGPSRVPGSGAVPGGPARRVGTALIAIAAVTLAIGATVSVVLIGESGVRSVWLNSFQ